MAAPVTRRGLAMALGEAPVELPMATPMVRGGNGSLAVRVP